MAEGLSADAADLALNALVADWVAAQLHTGDPGTAGTANVSTVTTRQGLTWGAAGSGEIAVTNTPEWTDWNGSDTSPETYISGWSDTTGGTYGGAIQLSAPVTMETGDSLTLTGVSVTITTVS